MKFCQKNLWSGEIWLNDISFAHLMLDLIFLVTHFGTSLWLVLFSVQLSHTYCCWDHCMRCSNSGHVFLLLDSTIILLSMNQVEYLIANSASQNSGSIFSEDFSHSVQLSIRQTQKHPLRFFDVSNVSFMFTTVIWLFVLQLLSKVLAKEHFHTCIWFTPVILAFSIQTVFVQEASTAVQLYLQFAGFSWMRHSNTMPSWGNCLIQLSSDSSSIAAP